MCCGFRMAWFLPAMLGLRHVLSFSLCSSPLANLTPHSRPDSDIATSRKPSLCQMELASPSQCWHLPCLSGLEDMDVGVEGARHYWLHIRGGVRGPSPTVCVLGLL